MNQHSSPSPYRPRVKICGITRPQDGLHAALCGADAIGLVFYDPSPRAVSIEQAQAVRAALPAFVTVVGLFVNAPAGTVNTVLSAIPLDLLQFHGEETADYCAAFRRPYIKALRMKPGTDVMAFARQHPQAQGLLLDAYVPGVPGGTGQRFDWQSIPDNLPLPLILSGGLTPDNVAEAVAAVQPFAVDVSGGVESTKGIKDAARVAAFIQNATQQATALTAA